MYNFLKYEQCLKNLTNFFKKNCININNHMWFLIKMYLRIQMKSIAIIIWMLIEICVNYVTFNYNIIYVLLIYLYT